jgi:allantoinase
VNPIFSAHVHLNEPGRTDWEGFWTGTRAAASGGITTVVDMPLNSIPPTTSVDNLEVKRHAARSQCWTDVAFWGGVIPGNQVCILSLFICMRFHGACPGRIDQVGRRWSKGIQMFHD